METRNVKFGGNIGDMISLIPAMRQYHRIFNVKVVLYLWLDRQAVYYIGATHPCVDANGIMVMLNQKFFDLIRPLLLAQDFMEDVKVWEGEEIKLDFDRLHEIVINKPYGSLNRWPFYLYPNLARGADLSKIWIDLPRERMDVPRGTIPYENKIIINRTERYYNPLIHYFFLKDYQDEIIFTGTKQEHWKFCKEWGLEVEHYEAPDFLELAQVIQKCKFFIGNQSACFQLAEGLKVPRILEICAGYPNVIPTGGECFDFQQQLGLEDAFNYLMKKYE